MVGFIKGLFGSKKPQEPTVEQKNTPVEPTQTAKTYFLSADDAKTFGNIDYMRTPKKIRRTFPKTASTGKSSEFIQSVSSMEMKRDGQISAPSASPASSTPAAPKPAEERRRTDSSMDMFRNMAKDIKR